MEPTRTNRYLRGGSAAVSPLSFPDDQFEFDEAEVWHSTETVINTLPEAAAKKVGFAKLRKPSRKKVNVEDRASGPKSLPVNVPDWSKILGGEYKERAGDSGDGYGEAEGEGDGNFRLPPHEYLARTRVASFSVHEGVGRTLKGRDLSRVRNAIWKQTGFED